MLVRSAIDETGKIEVFQIALVCIMMIDSPLSYTVLRLGYSPNYAMIVAIFTSVSALVARLVILKRQIPQTNVAEFVGIVVKNIVMFFAVGVPLYYLFENVTDNFGGFVLKVTLAVCLSVSVVVMFGLRASERNLVCCKVKSMLKR